MYPRSDVVLAPVSEGFKTLGINRIYFRDGLLIELGLIIPKQKGMDAEKFLSFALEQMDIYASGFVMLAPVGKK
jgi:hypothetical protein